MADKTVVVRAVYRSNVAQGLRQDAGAIVSLSSSVESSAAKTVNSTRALGAASAVAGKLMILGIGGAMAVSAKAAIDFESSLTGVAKTTDLVGNSFDANSGPLFQFGQALRSLSLRVPINVNELARIAELGGQLGIQIPNLLDFTEVMAELGVTTNLSSEEAATGFARLANIMRTPQTEFRRLGSVVVELGNNLATTESEILAFATRIAPVARIVGASEEEVFALAGALTSLGIPAQRGGTAVQKWMITAKKAVDEGGDSLDLFAKTVGVTNEEFQNMFRESPARAFNAFAEGLDRINKTGGDLFGTLDALQLGEVRTTQVLLAAAGGADVLTESLQLSNAEGQKVTALQEEAAKRFGTTASQIQLLGNSFNDLRIEIGNALLGSGGLAFGIDVLREFFGIIKDNLGVLQGMVTVAGVLVTLRLGVFFFQAAQKAQQAIGAFKGTAAAVQGLTGTARLAQGGMLALTGAMQGALGIAGLLAGAWAIMAINAAEAKAEARQLREEIENGAEPIDLFSQKISEALNDKQIKRLHEMGFSVRDLARYLMDGRPAASDFGQALAEAGISAEEAMKMSKGQLQVAGAEAIQVTNMVESAAKSVDNFFKVRTNELVDALIESGKATSLTNDKMTELAENAIRTFGFDITNEGFVASIVNLPVLMDEADHRAGQMFLHFGTGQRDMRDEMNQTDMAWQDYLDPEQKSDILEGFFDDNLKAVDEFVKAMDEKFQDVGDVIRSGFPVWDEYKQVVLGAGDTPSFQTVIKAQEKFIEDQQDFVDRMPSILDMGASVDTVAWLDSLETPIKGAIGRLNDAQLEELIAGANRNFAELHKIHLLRWMQIYPDNANLAFGAMVGELASRVDEMNLPGEQSGEAFAEGLMEIISNLPEDLRPEFLSYLTELLQNETWMDSNGYNMGDAWVQGLVRRLADLAGLANTELDKQASYIKQHQNGIWTVGSPSKWWRNLGEQMTAGLQQGIQGMGDINIPFSPQHLMPEMIAGAGSMSTVNNHRNTSYNLTVNGGGGSNLNAEAQTLLTLLTIVGGVEQGAGR